MCGLSLSLFLSIVSTSAVASPLTKVDNGDGSYSYSSAIGYSGPTTKVDGMFTLQYVGPMTYAWAPSLASGATFWDDGVAPTTTDPVAELVGGTIVDDDFNEWEIVAVDQVALAPKVASYFAQFSEAEGPQSQLVPMGSSVMSAMYDPLAGLDEEPGDFDFDLWSTKTCGTGPNADRQRVWMPGTQRRISSPTDFVHGETSAILTLNTVGGGQCSGVSIDDHHVLTAAHCVWDESWGGQADRRDLEVCRYGGYPVHDLCTDVEDVFVFPEYKRSQRAKFDWAVLKVDRALGSPGRHMALSRASDGRLSSIVNFDDHRMGGIPAIPDTGTCSGNSDIHIGEDGSFDHAWNRTIQIDVTHADGDSGGAHYYDGSTPGGTWYVYGVHSGHFSWALNRAAKGPKVPFYHSAIIAAMR